jgi:hypothetical protein
MLPSLPLRLRDEAMVLHFTLVAGSPPGAHGTTGGQSGWRSATGGRALVGVSGAAGALYATRTGGTARIGLAPGAVGSQSRTGGF